MRLAGGGRGSRLRRIANAWVELVRDRGGAGLAASLLAAMGELLTLEQVFGDTKASAQSANSTRRRSSTAASVAAPTEPHRRIRRSLEIERAASQITNEGFLRPPSGGIDRDPERHPALTCGYRGRDSQQSRSVVESIVRDTRTGLVRPCSRPATGLMAASQISPRDGALPGGIQPLPQAPFPSLPSRPMSSGPHR